MKNLSINVFIDFVKVEYALTNPIEIAEMVEQLFGKEVNIGYVEHYLDVNEGIDEKQQRKVQYHSKFTGTNLYR